ncbi:hypothetical protein OIU78_022174 [Salix suchowensis]|nr:hypothetical protein OIU78_022174 [Salix suchowensis]
MQGFGILAGGIVAMAVSATFGAVYKTPAYSVDPIGSTGPQADYVWRTILMLGALPAALTYYSRMKMPETPRYTALVAKNAEKASQDMSKVMGMEVESQKEIGEEKVIDKRNSFGLLSREFLRRHGLHLLGTASTWFLLDIAYYSQNLFQKDIFSAVGWLPRANTMSAMEELFKIARAQFLIALCGTVPGYWVTVFLIDHIGRFTIQLTGFFFMTVFMFVLAIPYHHWTLKENNIGFIVIYGLTFFFANFGPNSTTFHSASGDFPCKIQNQDKSKVDPGYPAGIGMKNALMVLGMVNVFGFLLTFLVPEPKGRSLEEVSGENEEVDRAHPTGAEATSV